MANNWQPITDDYDIYNQSGDTVSERPGSPTVDENGEFIWDNTYFPQSTPRNSVMDQDPVNTGPTNDFWTTFPLSIDINGYVFYNGENTGINVRGPAGASHLSFDELTPAQKESLKGEPGTDGINGTNGRDGIDGTNGLDAYQLWLRDNGWSDDPEHHPISDFYAYLANLEDALIKEGSGNGSLILNYKGVNSSALGAGSLAAGFNTVANGQQSFAFGNNTIAYNAQQVAFGRYNKTENNSILEIGNGTENNRSNSLWLLNDGNLFVSGDYTNSYNETLHSKVDKIEGKQLSTNDFTNNYKSFIDNYQVDNVLNISSLNPISNAAVTTALDELVITSSKPAQVKNTNNNFLGFFHPTVLSDGTMETAQYTDELLWNPSTHTLKINNNTVNGNYNFIFGSDLVSNNNHQIIFGYYNNINSNDLFEIGNGIESNLHNAFAVRNNGNCYAGGTFIDASGNSLANKQDILSYDEEPTQNSNNIVNSGDLYTYLVAHGINPEGGLNIPELTILQNKVTQLTTQVNTLTEVVNGLLNPREIVDDTYTYKTYILGVDKDELYIKLKETEEEEVTEG